MCSGFVTNEEEREKFLGSLEGGCGACVVLLSKYDPLLRQVDNYAVNSCLTLLCSVNRCSITTSEGLGNSRDGFHPIHQRFAGFHASQCGFCTPGMSVSLFSALVNAERTHRPDPPLGFSKITASEAEKAIAGNLCRCTGYRPIADACKSFAADVDMEDLGINSFWKKGESTDIKISRLPFYSCSNDQVCTYPDFLKNEYKSAVFLSSERKSWYSPLTIEELQVLLELCSTGHGTRTKLIVGNTGTGYYKELEQYAHYVDLRHIPELSSIRRDHMGINIGAAVTISEAIVALREKKKGEFSEGEQVFKKIAEHMEKIASGSIRNSASVGGNLVMAQSGNFPSDIATILLAVGSTVNLMTGLEHENPTLEEFLARPPLRCKSVLISIQIPRLEPERDSSSSKTDTKLLFETYRAAPRPLGNALPYLNAAFLADVSLCKTGVVINNISIALGAYGVKHAIRARKVEEYLTGKLVSANVLFEAVRLIKEAVIPEDGTLKPAYRSSLAVSYLFEFFCPFVDTGAAIWDGWLDGDMDTIVEKASKENIINNQFDNNGKQALISSAKQVLESSREYYPVGEPMTKSGAAIQASGEAVYVDDIPSPLNCLHGAFIYSTKPLAWVKDIKFKNKSPPDGVTSVISYKDIPKGGENIGSKAMYGSEPLFADEVTRCAGQPIAFVVADTQKHADIAAAMALVDYDVENLEPPILTVEEAVKRSSFFEVPPFIYPTETGDFLKGMAEADHKILSAEIKLGSQYYFYMETQTALAVPDEDNCMVVYCSMQCPETAHTIIARCLGIPEHNVRVVTRRVGGGFGGKAVKAMPVATACALAANKLRRPVRIYLNRKTDMIMAGGRHPMKITYSVGFKSSGKLTALHLEILINAGIAEDISPLMSLTIIAALKKYDWGALSFDIKVCKTNHSSKSAMRAPGDVQGSYIAEAVIEHVASTLSMEVDSIRHKNLHTFESLSLFYGHGAGEALDYTLPSIWDMLARSSCLEHRVEVINQFNQSSKWWKKGISRVPILHEVLVRPCPGKVSILRDGSVVVEVGGIELGQGLWTKAKQMTAYSLGALQCDGTEDLVDRVRVIQSDTLRLIQGGMTAGSTTSESSCEAVRLSCNILVERLAPLKKKLLEQMDSVSWEVLILQAHQQAVNLSASSYFVPEFSSMQYLNYGAAVSEDDIAFNSSETRAVAPYGFQHLNTKDKALGVQVEINLLTGETRILQVDLMYDCGQSMNPAVDLGQIEGAFVQGIGFFMLEEYLMNSDGLVVTEGTWTYKIPTIDTVPRQFNVHVLNSGHHKNRVLSSKASGEPPLLLAVSVHCATRAAIKEARKQLSSWSESDESEMEFQLEVPATMPVVKELCGLDNVERYLQSLLSSQ
ncbi:hypothetical protein RJ639_047523 [Escallonia herrerae]|uniref:indole-3-acetaldehyde oxidase n=1 Tax=Escallonia herrerae TaxID=1293975 RepID=A0AA88W525_9ASTE|nr:hypothetical protein RJ639_047523 [Escallonia herrerae]